MICGAVALYVTRLICGAHLNSGSHLNSDSRMNCGSHLNSDSRMNCDAVGRSLERTYYNLSCTARIGDAVQKIVRS